MKSNIWRGFQPKKIITQGSSQSEIASESYNNAMSQFRAQAVHNYLLKMGVPEEKLSTTWYGALKPVARNDTDEGRALNRRVSVLLIKR